MARPRAEPARSTTLAVAALRYARARGLATDALLERAGLEADAPLADALSLPPARLSELLATLAAELGEPHLGLSLSPVLLTLAPSRLELSVRASATVFAALDAVARAAAAIHPWFEGRVARDGDGEGGASLRFETPTRPRGAGRVASELAVALTLDLCREESSEALAPTRAWFADARPPDLAPLHRALGTRALEFGAADTGLRFSAEALARPMRASPRLAAAVAALTAREADGAARGNGIVALVDRRLRARLPATTSLDEAAAALHLSARTLQRRLEEQGTSFAEVVDTVRADLARTWLRATALPLAELAYRLGFADVAAFTKAFKRWTGTTPGRFRNVG